MTKSSARSYVRPSMLANVNVKLAMSLNHRQSVLNLTLDINVMVNWQPIDNRQNMVYADQCYMYHGLRCATYLTEVF